MESTLTPNAREASPVLEASGAMLATMALAALVLAALMVAVTSTLAACTSTLTVVLRTVETEYALDRNCATSVSESRSP
eukprot:2290563-Prymnesium_polylepis.1